MRSTWLEPARDSGAPALPAAAALGSAIASRIPAVAARRRAPFVCARERHLFTGQDAPERSVSRWLEPIVSLQGGQQSAVRGQPLAQVHGLPRHTGVQEEEQGPIGLG